MGVGRPHLPDLNDIVPASLVFLTCIISSNLVLQAEVESSPPAVSSSSSSTPSPASSPVCDESAGTCQEAAATTTLISASDATIPMTTDVLNTGSATTLAAGADSTAEWSGAGGDESSGAAASA